MMTPLQYFDKIFRRVEFSCRFFGVDIFNPNYTLNTVNLLFGVGMCTSLPAVLYTVVAYDLQVALQSITVVGIAVQGVLKYNVFLENYSTIYSQHKYLKDVHLRLQDAKTSRYNILLKWDKMFMILSNVMVVTITVAFSCFVMLPLIVYLTKGIVEPMLPIMFPGLDTHTVSGYIILQMIHIFYLSCTMVGFVAAEMAFTTLALYSWPLAYLFVDHFNELNQALEDAPTFRSSKEMRFFFRNIIILHQEFSLYMKNTSSFYTIMGFVDSNTNAMTLAFCAFMMLVMDWFPIYAIAALFLVKLFALCILGTLVEMTNDIVLDTIQYSNWYLLPVDIQRHLKLMIVKAQRTPKLMAGTAELNLMLFVNLMKSIYSFIMLMIEADISL